MKPNAKRQSELLRVARHRIRRAPAIAMTKLTKKQKARAKQAVLSELLLTNEYCGYFPNALYRSNTEWPEVRRLLRVAIDAVRADGKKGKR